MSFGLLLSATPGWAATGKAHAKYDADHWGVDQGLLQENVSAVLQTRDGYLWIGSDGGLSRFDGVKFVSYRSQVTPGLVGNTVRSLFEDSKGVLWIGTDHGVSRYVGGKFEPLPEISETDSALEIVEDAEHSLWIATDHSIYRRRGEKVESFASDPVIAGRGAVTVFCDSRGRVWIGIEGLKGVVCYENEKFRVLDDPEGLFTSRVAAVTETARDTIWFGMGGGGIVRFADGKFTRLGLESGLAGNYIVALFGDLDGSLWVGSMGLQRCDTEGPIKFETVVSSAAPSIRHVSRDAEGSIWIAAYGEGLMRVRPARYKILNSEAGLPGDFVRTVMQDASGTMWLAQGGNGVVGVSPDGTTNLASLQRRELETDEAMAVYMTRSGDLWSCGKKALYIRHNGQVQTLTAYSRGRAIFEDSKSEIWLGTFESGLVNWKNGVFTQMQLPTGLTKATPCAFAEDSDGTLYVGTMHDGILKIKDGQITVINRHNGLPDDEVRALYIDGDHNLWVGTKMGPAVLSGGKWYSPPWMLEMLDQYITGFVKIPGDYLLVSTSRGVARVSSSELLAAMKQPVTPERLHKVVITEAARSGNLGTACYPFAWTTKSGEVWLASRKGAVVIDPARIQPASFSPPVVIEQLAADSKEYAGKATVNLSAGTRQLAIDYTALTFVQPGRVYFKYQLEGYEDDWVDAGTRRTAYYNNLPPGPYVFRVKACNSDGLWNEQGAALAFSVQPFYYQTPWFRVLVFAVVIAMAAAIFRWRIRRFHRAALVLQQQNIELERRISERTAELAKSFEALKASEYFYHSLVESLPQIIVRKDASGRFTYANSAFGELLGRPLAEIIGKSDADCYPPELAEKYRAEDQRIMVTRQSIEFETVVQKNGKQRYLHVKKVPFHNDANESIGVQVLFWDVTIFRETQEKLKAAQAELIETSRLAGMAEVATGVLHNIGNALNSVNTSATLASDRMAQLKIPSVGKVAQLLLEQRDRMAEFFATDPRGQKLPAYLAQLSEHLQADRENSLQELKALREGVEHIKEIVAAQQNYARISGITDVIVPAELVDFALSISGASPNKLTFAIVREFSPTPPITVQRQQVLQILVNLIRNAKEAMAESSRPERKLTLGVKVSAEGKVQISVTDNGIGIATENLDRIFAFGFTTKKTGHGFGLHSSALVAKELGGSLHAYSAGLGEGATFILEIPASSPAPTADSLTTAMPLHRDEPALAGAH